MNDKNYKYSNPTDVLEGVVKNNHADKISIRDLTTALRGGSFGVVMFIMSLPILVPLPPPLPSVIAFPLIFISIQMMLGIRSIWLPKWLAGISFKRETLALMIAKGNPIVRKFERILRPRIELLSSDFGEKLIGFLAFIFSASVLIPLPFTNLLPGLGILIMSFGLIGRDGMVILLGILLGFGGLIFTFLTMLLGKEILDKILSIF